MKKIKQLFSQIQILCDKSYNTYNNKFEKMSLVANSVCENEDNHNRTY